MMSRQFLFLSFFLLDLFGYLNLHVRRKVSPCNRFPVALHLIGGRQHVLRTTMAYSCTWTRSG